MFYYIFLHNHSLMLMDDIIITQRQAIHSIHLTDQTLHKAESNPTKPTGSNRCCQVLLVPSSSDIQPLRSGSNFVFAVTLDKIHDDKTHS